MKTGSCFRLRYAESFDDPTFERPGSGVTPLRIQRIELTELSGRIKTRRATARAG
jgi:protein subunit release factor A